MKKTSKHLGKMTTAELREVTKGFDAEFVRTRPLSPAMKRRLRDARRRVGRPTVGQGSTSVLISIERGLLTKADALARRQNLSRSELIAQGLKHLLKAG